jgi:zinc protease
MGSESDPLQLEYGEPIGPLRLVRQAPPAGSASFSATYVAPAGWGFDGTDAEGTARLTNLLLASGAGPWGRVELARRLDRAGATLSTDASPESGEITVWGPSEEWESLLGLLAEAVLRPRFDPPDIARAKRQFHERQLRQRTQPAGRAHLELLHGVFPGGHPYRETGIGTARSIDRLSRASLRHFHRAHYGGAGSVLVVTHPSRLPTIARVASRLFRRLGDGPQPALSVPAVPQRAPVRVEIDLPGQSQVEVRTGGPSLAQGAPDYPAGFLGNQVLGGRPLIARLFQNVREKGGLAYGASSHLETMRFGGWWVAGAGTGADRWERVVPMVEREVQRLRTALVPPAELRTVRESAIGEIPLGLESTAEAHELAVEVAYHELPPDFWVRWPDRLRAVSAREVRDASARAFDANHSATVVVGPLHPK